MQKLESYAFLIPALFFIAYAVVNIGVFLDPGLEGADLASYSLQIIRAKSFSEYLGPYSRFSFNHPGPISFYYQALMETPLFFIPTPYGRHLAAQLLLNVLFIFLAFRLLRSSVEKKGFILVFFILFLLCLYPRGRDIFIHPWPPSLLIFPMTALIPASARIACGELKHLWVAAVSAVFIVQNNISGLAIVAPFMLMTSALYVLSVRRSPSPEGRPPKGALLEDLRRHRKVIIVSLVFVLVAFLPPVYEQISSEKGNFTKVLEHFKEQEGIQHSLPEAAAYISGFFKAPLGSRFPISPVAALLVLACMSLLNFTQRDKFISYLVLFTLSGIVFSIAGAMTVQRRLLEYIFRYETAFAGFLFFTALVPLLKKIKIPRPAGKVLLVLAALAAVPSAVALFSFKPQPPNPKFNQLLEAINPRKGNRYQFFFRKGGPHHDQWGVATRLALQMVRQGCSVCVPEEWELIFGKKLTCPEDAAGVSRISLYTTDDYPGPVREHSYSAGGTTIEFGRLVPLTIPLDVRFDSPDEYFVNWTTAGIDRRGAEGPSSKIIIPLGAVAPEDSYLLKISLQSKGQGTTKILINGRLLAEEHFPPSEMGEKTYFCSPGLLKGHAENVLELKDAGFFISLSILRGRPFK